MGSMERGFILAIPTPRGHADVAKVSLFDKQKIFNKAFPTHAEGFFYLKGITG